MRKSAAYCRGFNSSMRKYSQLQLPDLKGMAIEHAGKYISDKVQEKDLISLLARLNVIKTRPQLEVMQ